jgi:hypothetical protein
MSPIDTIKTLWNDIVWNNVSDTDDIFAYETVKWVRVLDRRLGLVYYTVLILIIAYVVIYVCIIEKQYLDFEKSSGWIVVQVLNHQKSDLGITWDVYDRITNPGEQGAVFIPTRILITKGQTQEGFCESIMHSCTTPEECDIDNEMLQKSECVNGHCMRRQWCPAEDPSAATTQTQYLEFGNVELWFSTYVHYHKFQLDVATTDERSEIMYPMKRANTYPLHDLIRMANLDPEEVIENGALLIANALLYCDLDADSCDSKIETINVDTRSGYNYAFTHVYFEDGVRKRDVLRMYGIRVLAFATGFGKQISFQMIVLQLSSAIALMMVAQSAADFVLMSLIAERKHYTDQKVLQTEDFCPD